ncbi:hypothetical protein [Parabacteroides pacaensis]|uniref:hypothetical protein n=1 Tax=Parabacteroides pacaensis TaxID=2086575 RepID=UPI000D1114C8|nr:hypothetical protein [Parabacteroides pacaensis]
MRYIQLCILYILLTSRSFSVLCNDTIGGLLFRAYEYPKDERTSFVIPSPGQTVKFKDYLSLSFDLKIRRQGDHFGYICQLIAGEESSINLVLVNPVKQTPYLCIIKDQQYLGKIREGKINIYEWNRIHLEMEIDRDTLYVKENGVILAKEGKLPENRSVRICFGVNNLANFPTSDVAPMNLKNITFRLRAKETAPYTWPLQQPSPDGLLEDQSGNLTAAVTNPEWIINRHLHWEPVRSIRFTSKTYPVAAPLSNAFYFVSRDKVTCLDLIRNSLKEYPSVPEVDVERLTNQFIMVPDASGEGQLVYYDFEKPAGEYLSFFNFDTGKWTIPIERLRQSSYNQHNAFFNVRDSSVVQLFGYGFHTYFSELNRISLAGEIMRQELPGIITPRYLSSVGITDSVVYIYGGLGNEVGQQEYGVYNYRDLFTLDLSGYRLRKLWSIPAGKYEEVPAQTLLVDSLQQQAKGLFFNPTRFLSGLTLKNLNLKTGELTSLGDTIPYTFHDVSSYADLLYLPAQKRYYAVTLHQADTSGYEANVYSIASPVLASPSDRPQEKNRLAKDLVLITASLVMIAGFVLLRRYRKGRKNGLSAPVPVAQAHTDCTRADAANVAQPSIDGKKEGEEARGIDQEKIPYQAIKPGIYMLNGFQVINKDLKDITGKFTPVMRQLLTVIILYSNRNGKGISNIKLKELFWYDKSEESFSNNRSVNMRKIRLLLKEIGEVEITAENGYWYFLNKGNIYNDYVFATRLIKRVMPLNRIADGDLAKLLDLASCGQLLPNMQCEWIDEFKADYSDSMIGLLSKLRDSKQFEENDKMKISLAGGILRFDSLDEDSVRIKCRSLLRLKRFGAAHASFDQFVKEYKLLLNEEFQSTFEEFTGV